MKILSILKLVIVFIAFYYLFKSDNFDFNQLFKKEYFKNIEIFIFIAILISTTYFIGSLRWWLILKSLKYLIIFLILGISLKDINRINFGIKNSTYIWPNIYNSNMGYKKKKI